MDDGGRSLSDGEDVELGNVDVGRAERAPDNLLGNVLGDERLKALVDGLGLVLVAAEADDGEVGLDESGRDLGHADARVDELLHETLRERLDGVLDGAVHRAADVGLAASERANVDDVARVLLAHRREEDLRHLDERDEVRVDHEVDVLQLNVARTLSTDGTAGVVDEHVEALDASVLEHLRESVDGSAVVDVERLDGDLGSETKLLGSGGSVGGDLLKSVLTTREQDQVQTSLREQDRGRGTDTGRSAGDDGCESAQTLASKLTSLALEAGGVEQLGHFV